MKICLMTGARPNFIKVAPLIRSIHKAQSEGHDVKYTLVYAGSVDDPTLEGSLFDDLEMPRPDVYLGVNSHNVNEITSGVMSAFEAYLNANPTDVVIVVDDLASTMAAAIVAKKHGIRLAHLVAGTRSFDINMPKEINRLVIDGLSDLLFTAGSGTGTTADQSKIYVVGNILMDTLRYNLPRFHRPSVLDDKCIKDGEYAVLTINRRALLADEEKLKAMLVAMSREMGSLPVITPLRGEASKVICRLLNELKVQGEVLDNILIITPLSYLEFGYLTAHALCVLTDSGNVAEEATFNGVPCITLNNYTEHIETVKQGTNTLVNEDASLLADTLREIVSGEPKNYSIPERWDGRTADRILQTLLG